MKSPGYLLTSAAVLLAVPVLGLCNQQNAQNKRPVPSMTSDDVLVDRPVRPVEVPSAGKPKTGDEAQTSPSDKPSAAELSWREALKAARKQADSAQRRAEETELRITDLRNQLGAPGQGAGDRNQTMSDLGTVGDTLKQQKAEAREAADALNKLLEEGRQKGYKEEAGPSSVAKNGEPNEDYYRSKFAELSKSLEDAERRVQLYQNKVNELNQSITGNSRSGDNFFIGQIQEQRDEAQHSLEQAVEASQKAQADIAALKEQARASGVPPGVFR
jgi:hypothetical protein